MKVITFGEILLRLAPQGYLRLFQNNSLETSFCGAEANVAVSLANFGLDSSFVTKLPKNDVAEAAINSLRYFGVDISKIVRGGERIGLYYLEKGASQRSSKVLYDRAFSAISQANRNDFDWETIFQRAEWFHFTGINPALSPNLEEICLEACKTAKKKGITISCDLNYRKKLWTSEKARQVMSKFMPFVDVCIANEEDAEDVFGIKSKYTEVSSGKLNHIGYKEVAKALHDCFGCKYVAITLRTSISANDNKWAGMFYSSCEDKYCFSKEYNIHIVDRVGTGDSFCAGIIYGLIKKMSSQECLDFAVAASCLKHSIEGDYNRIGIEEIKNLMFGDESGRVKR
ncbi:sugar kinase [Clostridium sp. SHJSY1]|uniref:sugar kinase n=1 Tax=Clostridium sp. SHJSY1 TaxID=2942483 RepID=UPI002876BCC9|nr:sugar kinase [Clostridium sp. SHJSY1]MDS0526532.1 sugar kinase [Clostridium sp. SHJSY1]